jgi:hypothetical protein
MAEARQSNYADASAMRIADLVAQVKRGAVRVPTFQRGLRWKIKDVVELFDSVYNGYPIGSLLLRRGNASAERLEIGPIVVDAPETSSALWVIDGQQRITALAACLARPVPQPTIPVDDYVLYFDADSTKFASAHREGKIADTWVPVAQLLDPTGLSEWVYNWPQGKSSRLRQRVFDAGTRIREYRVPLYVVETDDDQKLRDIFYRINNQGHSLKWYEVHDALFGGTGGVPSTLGQLADEISQLGMGRPDRSLLLPCLVAFRGLDATRNIAEHYQKDKKALKGTVADALPALRSALSFLKRNAEIPHLRLLPRFTPLPILTRFFAVHPEPNPRTTTLLSRWVWRTLLSGGVSDERTLLRHGVSSIEGNDEEKTVQKLLKLVPQEDETGFSVPERFDARTADSRFVLLGMSSLRPIDFQSGREVQIADLIEARSVNAFRRATPTSDGLGASPANRILLPGQGAAHKDILQIADNPNVKNWLQSHAINLESVEFLKARNWEAFLLERYSQLDWVVNQHMERLAGWALNDRPSIAYLLTKGDT